MRITNPFMTLTFAIMVNSAFAMNSRPVLLKTKKRGVGNLVAAANNGPSPQKSAAEVNTNNGGAAEVVGEVSDAGPPQGSAAETTDNKGSAAPWKEETENFFKDHVDQEFGSSAISIEISKPEGYDDMPRMIPNENAEVPEGWDEDVNGNWEPPKIPNPRILSLAYHSALKIFEPYTKGEAIRVDSKPYTGARPIQVGAAGSTTGKLIATWQSYDSGVNTQCKPVLELTGDVVVKIGGKPQQPGPVTITFNDGRCRKRGSATESTGMQHVSYTPLNAEIMQHHITNFDDLTAEEQSKGIAIGVRPTVVHRFSDDGSVIGNVQWEGDQSADIKEAKFVNSGAKIEMELMKVED